MRFVLHAAAGCSLVILSGLASSAETGPVDGVRVHASWRATSVATIADRLGGIAGRPVVVDRRIDPTARIDLDGGGRAAEAVLAELARAAGGDLAVLRHSFRIAPADVARRVAAADAAAPARLGKLPRSLRDPLQGSQPLAWEAGTPPRELVTRLATEAAAAVENVEAIPHDHLPAGSLAAIPLGERLDLLLAHYDLRIAPSPKDRKELRIVPLEPSDGGADDGPPSDSTTTRTARPKAATRPTAVPVDRYTLRAEAPLEELLRTLAVRFGLAIEIERESLAAKGVAPGEIVRLSVENVSRSRLLDEITKPLSLSWVIEGGTLKVR